MPTVVRLMDYSCVKFDHSGATHCQECSTIESCLTPAPLRVNSCSCISARPVDQSQQDPLTHFVIVRADLPIGIIAANIAHAAGESSPGDIQQGTHAIVLAVPNETALKALLARLTLSGLAWSAVYEPDPPYFGQLMAIGLAPVLRSIGRRVLSSPPCFRGSTYAGVAQFESARKGDAGSLPAPGTRASSSEVEHSTE